MTDEVDNKSAYTEESVDLNKPLDMPVLGLFVDKKDFLGNPESIKLTGDFEWDRSFDKKRPVIGFERKSGEVCKININKTNLKEIMTLCESQIPAEWKGQMMIVEAVEFEGSDDISAGYQLKFYRE